MKILQVYRSLSLREGGPARSVPSLCREISAAGCEVTLLTNNDGDGADIEDMGGSKLLSGGNWKSNLLFAILWVAPRLQSLANSTDIVHLNGIWPPLNLFVGRWALKNKIPLIISPRASFLPADLNKTLIKQVKKWVAWNLSYRNLLNQCHAIHVTAFNELESIKAINFKKDVALIPNGICSEEFEKLPSRIVLNRYFPHIARKRILLFLSRIHPVKGLSILAHAWGSLSSRFPDWHLLIVGPDYNNHWLHVRKILESYNNISSYTYAGLLGGEARLAAYGAANLFVLPTLYENFGIAVAEALMAGVPVITTTEAPWQELVSNRCGWIIKPERAELTAALNHAMSLEDHVLREMGKRAREFVRDRYDWKRVALRMKEFYQWILRGGKRPDFVYAFEGKCAIRLPLGKAKKIL